MPIEILTSPEIRRRWEFGLLCNARGLMSGWAVEVGTDRAEFAVQFLDTWRGGTLYCVDPWDPYDDDSIQHEDRDADYQTALLRLAPYGWRARVLRMTGMEAIDKTKSPVAFVYIDADHSTESVLEDCHAWWERLEPGGILAGHDANDDRVKAGVRKFARDIGRRLIWRTGCPVGSPSWYLYKNPRTVPFEWEVGGWLGRYREE